MRAARFHARGDIRIENIPEPALRPGAVKVRVEWCGICGTDLHEYTDGPIFCPSPTEPHPLTGEMSPVVLGHEFAGVVVGLGDGVTAFALGDRVAVEPRMTCAECAACLAGRHNTCENAATIGLAGGGGGLAEFVVVDQELVFDMGELSFETGALIEPLAVAFHAVGRANAAAVESAVIFGAGPIGLLIAAVLKAQGCPLVILVEPSRIRRDRGSAAGADVVVDPMSEDYAGIVDKLTHGSGADVTFECAGVDAALKACLEVVKVGGTVVNVAIRRTPATVDLLPLVLKEISLVGTICYANDHPAVLDLLQSGRLDVEHIVTKRIDLTDLVSEGFEALLADSGHHAKILVRP